MQIQAISVTDKYNVESVTGNFFLLLHVGLMLSVHAKRNIAQHKRSANDAHCNFKTATFNWEFLIKFVAFSKKLGDRGTPNSHSTKQVLVLMGRHRNAKPTPP